MLVTVLMLRQATAYCVEAVILVWSAHSQTSRHDILRITITAVLCVGILLCDHRILVKELETAVPAVILAGAARASWTVARESGTTHYLSYPRNNAYYCVGGLVGTAMCLYLGGYETWHQFVTATEFKYIPILVVNLVANTTALTIGGTVLIPMRKLQGDIDRVGLESRLGDMVAVIASTAITGLVSTSLIRRSFSSWLQIFLFAGMIMTWISQDLSCRQTWTWLRSGASPTAFALLSVDTDGTFDSESSGASYEMEVTQPVHMSRRHFLSRIGFFFTLCLAWMAYLALNFSERVHQSTYMAQPILDLRYIPHTDLELVISMYKEPLDEVVQLISSLRAMPSIQHSQIHIYIKDGGADTDKIKQVTGAHKVTTLANIGREGETYLYHILENWETLAKQTIFLQAGVHNPREFYPRVRNYFDPLRTGMLNLGWSGQVCNCENCGDRFDMWDTTHLFPHISHRIDNSTKCDKMLLSYKGQFIVSAKRIRGIDKSIYRDLHDAFVDQNSWAHQDEYLQGRPDSMAAPVFGYTMERLWNLLFQCNSMEVAWKCPSLLSGNRIGGNIEDCQCFDPVS